MLAVPGQAAERGPRDACPVPDVCELPQQAQGEGEKSAVAVEAAEPVGRLGAVPAQGVSEHANRPVPAQLQKLHRQRAVPAVPPGRADRGDRQGDVGAGGKPLHCAAADAHRVQVCDPRPPQAEPGRPKPEQEQEDHVDVHLLAGQVPAAEEPEREQAAGGEQAQDRGVRLQDHAQLRPRDRGRAAQLQPQAPRAAQLEEGRVRGAAVPAGRRAGQTEVPRAAAEGERRDRAEQAAEAGAAGHKRDRRAGDARRADRHGQSTGPGTAVRHCAAAAAPAAAVPPVPGRRERGRDAAVSTVGRCGHGQIRRRNRLLGDVRGRKLGVKSEEATCTPPRGCC
ncbi:hypothetical protein KL943_004640 [Ogataea angusta]|nr:hypothetical protein KL943_004640 [Ogataea angusta]